MHLDPLGNAGHGGESQPGHDVVGIGDVQAMLVADIGTHGGDGLGVQDGEGVVADAPDGRVKLPQA